MSASAATQTAEPVPEERQPGFALSMTGLFAWGFALGAFFWGTKPLVDNSFLWHLRTGHLILDSGFPHADPYSFTMTGEPWVVQSWLAEVSYGLLDELGGGFALRVAIGLVAAVIGAATFLLAARICQDRLRAGALTVAALVPVLTIYNERPLGYGLLCTLALLWIVEVPDSFLGRCSVWTIPALFWLWSNVHGTWVLGGAYLLVHLAGRWADGRPPWAGHERTILIGGAIGGVLTAANPYGVDMTLFPFRLVSRGEILSTIVEWQSPSFRTKFGIAFALWLAVLFLAALRGNRPSRRDTVVAIVFVLLGLWALRNISVATLVTLPVAARALTGVERPDVRSRTNAVAAALILACFGIVIAMVSSESHFRVDDRWATASFERLAADGLLGSRLYTTDGNGGYLIWKYWPDQLVFMDDRYGTYPTDVIEDYRTISNVKPGWLDALDERGVEIVVWEQERALSQALDASTTWERLGVDDDWVTFVRSSQRR